MKHFSPLPKSPNHHRKSYKDNSMKSFLSVLLSSKISSRDFPHGPVVKNLPASAGDTGSIPGPEMKIPHTAGQLNPRTLEPVFHNKGSYCSEKPMHRKKELYLLAANSKSPCTQ